MHLRFIQIEDSILETVLARFVIQIQDPLVEIPLIVAGLLNVNNFISLSTFNMSCLHLRGKGITCFASTR